MSQSDFTSSSPSTSMDASSQTSESSSSSEPLIDAISSNEPKPYTFPTDRLRLTLNDPTKTPLCVVACGSFSPVTYMHLRMFEMAMDHSSQKGFEIVGGYLSPVGDAYKKRGLASAKHRVRMCQMAARETSTWLMIDPWEALKQEYTPTARVLDHFNYEINTVMGGVAVPPTAENPNPERRPVRIVLLAGSDLIRTMGEPGVWAEADLDHILMTYGCFIIERSGSKLDKALDILQQRYHRNIYVIQQPIANDVSSTKIRDLLSQGMSVNYLLPSCVVEYIRETGLYRRDGHPDPLEEAEESREAKDGK